MIRLYAISVSVVGFSAVIPNRFVFKSAKVTTVVFSPVDPRLVDLHGYGFVF